jgi:hypothetical protein
MNLKRMKGLFVCVVGVAMAGGLARADSIVGNLQVVGSVTVGETTITWAGGQLGVLGNLNTGSFAPFNMPGDPTGTTPINVMNLTGPPISGPTNVPNFITFPGPILMGAHLDLTLISPGSDGSAGCTLAAAVGEICTPPNSPFNLQDVQDSANPTTVAPGTPCEEQGVTNPSAVPCAVSITFLFSGNAVTASGGRTIFTGTFSTQTTAGVSSVSNPRTYQDILAALQANGGTGTVSESFSGVITASVPEPGSATTLIVGVAMLVFGLARKRSRAAN